MQRRAAPSSIGLVPREGATVYPDVAPPEARTATDRSLAIIDFVLSADAPLSAKMIGAALDLPKATVHRLLGGLEDKGLLVKDPLSGGYAAGASLTDIAFKILRRSAASADRHVVLAGLVAEIGETCNLGILDGGEARYVDRVEASHSPLKLDVCPGSRVPLYASAMGKLFLAAMPAGALDRYLFAAQRTAFTPATLIETTALRAALAEIRKSGHADDDEEYIAGVNCLAVAVPVARARHLLALAVQAPKSRKNLDELRGFLPVLQEAARKLAVIFDNDTPGRS
jgi:IclR family acetate operon transcriptional repressor